MPQSLIIGPSGNMLEVDPLYKAARVALRPYDYSSSQTVLGHYSVAQASGATVSIGAAGHLGSIRWTDTSRYLVLLRIRAGWAVTAAVTAAAPMDLQAVIARSFSVDFTTASTAISLAGVANTNKMRASMGASLMGTVGPRIATTTVMSGQTLTADAAPFAMMNWQNQPSGNATVTQAAGVAGPMQTLYDCTASGQHPVILTANEGVILQPVTAGPVSGTTKYYFEWTWAEVAAF